MVSYHHGIYDTIDKMPFKIEQLNRDNRIFKKICQFDTFPLTLSE